MKRMVCSVLLAALLLTSFFLPASAAEPVFEIYTVEDLLAFADAISHTAENEQAGRQSAILMADLDMSGVEWETMYGAEVVDGRVVMGDYNGTFDGNDHTITGLSGVCSGFFGRLGENGVIRDLTLEDVAFTGKDGFTIYVGGIASRCYGRIENCHISGTFEGQDVMYLGGITGCIEYDAAVVNCTSALDMDLTITQHGVDSFGYFVLAGIAGMSNGLVDGCVNYGSITARGLNCGCGSNIGGVVGINSYGSTGLRNCGNAGDISVDLQVKEDQSANTVHIGGVTGDNYGSLMILNCFNTGAITGTVQGEEVCCSSIGRSDSYRVYHRNCWSDGAVSVTSDVGGRVTTEGFRETSDPMLYYLNEAAAAGSLAGQYFKEVDLRNEELVNELNRNLAELKDPTLRLWEQGEEGPVLTDRTWDDSFVPEIEEEQVEFSDVISGAYYEAAVAWAVTNNITSGTGNGCFSPNDPCTRGQVVTFLWRAAGSPEPESAVNPFSDVKASDYYYKAVLWAVENEITSGMGGGKFAPNDPCTRGQVVTFQWRAAGEPSVGSASNPFVDVKNGDYYYSPVLWAVENGITSGIDATHFGADATCSRGQIVTFLYRAE